MPSWGLKSLSFEDVKIALTRFDIDLLETNVSSGRLSIDPPIVVKCQVIAYSRKSGRRVALEAKLITPPALPDLRPEQFRVRLIAPMVDVLLEFSISTFNFDTKLD